MSTNTSPRERGRPRGRVAGSWRARAEAAGVAMSTFRREALAEAFLERCPFAREWTRNSVFRAAEGSHRTPTRYHAELIERAKETSERADGVHVPGGDGPEERRRRGWILQDMKSRAHEDAAAILARAWDGERLLTVWSKRGRDPRYERLYVPRTSAADVHETDNARPRRVSDDFPYLRDDDEGAGVPVSLGSKTDPIGTVKTARPAARTVIDVLGVVLAEARP